MFRKNYFQGGGVGGRAEAFVRGWTPAFKDPLKGAVATFLAGFDDPVTPPGIYLWGPVGTGKTVTALWLTRQVQRKRWRIASDRGLIGDFRRTLDPETNECTRDGWLRSFHDADAFFLDDLGSGKGYTDWEGGVLNEIIDRLYQRMVPLVVTSNLSLPELSLRLGDRISSRVAEMCEVVKVEGKDHRLSGKVVA